MKISDFIFAYRPGKYYRKASLCRVRLFIDDSGIVTALVTDLGEKNPGKSITNAIEVIWEQLIECGHITRRARLIQHYERHKRLDPSYSLVTVRRRQPSWKELSTSEAAKLIGCTKKELALKTLEDERLSRQVEQIRTAIDPFAGMKYPEDPDVLLRRQQIQDKMVSKAAVHDLIAAGSGERAIQALLKSDLSIIAEVYAHPEEEYVTVSELHLESGFVDFAILSGRSRMDVTLVEIKGADFNIVNLSGYKNFASKFNEAAQQIRARLGYIVRNYEEFRQFIHEVRADVEAGNSRYSGLLGPFGELEVDPNKDISLRYVLIAGRTINDVAESKIRHEYELSFNPPIRVESWDTWIKKLRRS